MPFPAAKIQTDEVIELTGVVLQVLPGGVYRVELSGGRQIVARTVGRLRHEFIRIAAGNLVKVEFSAFDLDRGRIVSSVAALG